MAKIKTTTARPSAVTQAQTPSPRLDDDQRPTDELVFGKQTMIWIGAGIVLMLIGMGLMAGGGMPSPDVWDDELIYSFRRITLAPIVILAGLGVITYAILKK